MLRSAFPCLLFVAGVCLCCGVAAQEGARTKPAVTAGQVVSSKGAAEVERRQAAAAVILAALEQRRDLKFEQKPLDKMLDELKRELKIDIHLDRKSLEDEGVDTSAPVSIQFSGRQVRTALTLALDPLGLTCYEDDGVLRVVTKVRADEHTPVRVYEVSDLVLRDLDDPDAGADYDSLIAVLTTTVHPASWDQVGGRGSAAPFDAAGINVLVVAQTCAVHEEIEVLLARLRKAKRGDSRKRVKRVESLAIANETGPAPPSGPLPANADRDALRWPQTQLACDLYAQVAKQQKDANFLVSPYSVAHALSLVAAGAKGETAAELARALHGELPAAQLHPAMAAQAQELPLGTFQGQQLRLANRLWAQRADTLPLDDFLRTTRTHYGAELAVADLADDATRKSINAWVEEQTGGKIRDLFEPGAFDGETRLVLANALYFQGLWRNPFLEHDTKDRAFKAPTGEIQTATMSLEDFEADYAKLEGLELLTKAYRGSLVMTVLLPKAGTDFAEFERSLTAANLKQWLAAGTRSHVQIFLPKFKHETALDLEPVLAGLGVKKAFTAGQADLTGIRDDGALYLYNWRHRATIEVDEKGTIAAAATGGGGGFFGGVPDKPRVPVFRADRPFVYLIRDLRTGTILFLGRVMNPAA